MRKIAPAPITAVEKPTPAAAATSSAVAQIAPPTLLYVIKQVELAVRSRLDDMLRPVGLTALQYTALTVLERQPNLSSAQLARNSFVTPQSMSDLLAALHGLIERHPDQQDRRRLVISLTPAGRQMLTRYRVAVAALEVEMLADLTADQVVELRRSLIACRAAIAEHPPR